MLHIVGTSISLSLAGLLVPYLHFRLMFFFDLCILKISSDCQLSSFEILGILDRALKDPFSGEVYTKEQDIRRVTFCHIALHTLNQPESTISQRNASAKGPEAETGLFSQISLEFRNVSSLKERIECLEIQFEIAPLVE